MSACTLRQALDGRLPTLRTVLAFARAARADEVTARRLWTEADRADRPPRRRSAPHVPGNFTTPAGLLRAMNAVRATAPDTTFSALARKAGPGLSSSALHRLLTGQQIPTTAQLTAFADACNAGELATAALLAGHDRVVNGLPPRPVYPCAYTEETERRRYWDENGPWLPPELDRYEQQLRDEAEAAFQNLVGEAEARLKDTDGELTVRLRAASGSDRPEAPAGS
ncbi:hypothetical protein [Streptomyces sp. NPDC001770]